MAPDIWFNFLRSGGNFDRRGEVEDLRPSRPAGDSPRDPAGNPAGDPVGDLLGICDHNVRDIFGLASLFRAFAEIAAAPLEAAEKFRCDEENLALCWRCGQRQFSRRQFSQGDLWNPRFQGNREEQQKTAALLLRAAARDYPRSCLRLAFDLRSQGRYGEARKKLEELLEFPPAEAPEIRPPGRPEGRPGFDGKKCSPLIRALALRTLSIDTERRLGRRETALAYIKQALALESLPAGLRKDLEKRRERLRRS
jgi:tetratricopeptide (TPR) repeat protein